MTGDMDAYAAFVRERLDAGDDPDTITDAVEQAITDSGDWVLMGDGCWHRDTVCPTCGSWAAGVCGHEQTPIPRSAYRPAEPAP